ncbi:MAG: NADH-quinone oxidoreductase subunit H, partial [Acetobacteraceae bacterium]|nr:NADH-quinone oxidoreductase subunit H [Acetobacteraceae bacterium]
GEERRTLVFFLAGRYSNNPFSSAGATRAVTQLPTYESYPLHLAHLGEHDQRGVVAALETESAVVLRVRASPRRPRTSPFTLRLSQYSLSASCGCPRSWAGAAD